MRSLGQLVCAATEMELLGYTRFLSLVAWGPLAGAHLARARASACLGISGLIISEQREEDAWLFGEAPRSLEQPIKVEADEATALRRFRSLTQCPTDGSPMEQTMGREGLMTNEFTAVVESDGEWFIAYCAEIPGANGQGRTKEEALENLSGAVALILEDRREDALGGLPADARASSSSTTAAPTAGRD